MKSRLKAAIRFIADLVIVATPHVLLNGAGLAGVGLIGYGAWLIYAPAGFIAWGVLLLAGAILAARGLR